MTNEENDRLTLGDLNREFGRFGKIFDTLKDAKVAQLARGGRITPLFNYKSRDLRFDKEARVVRIKAGARKERIGFLVTYPDTGTSGFEQYYNY